MMARRWGRRCASTLFQTQAERRMAREKFRLTPADAPTLRISGGEGVWARGADGRRYLDLVGGFGSLPLGHCPARLLHTLSKQAEGLALAPPCTHSDLLGAACQLLAGSTGHARALLLNTGAEAVETAIKFARRVAYDHTGIPADRAVTLLARPLEEEHTGPYPFPGFLRVPYGDIGALSEALSSEACAAALVVEPVHVGAQVLFPAPDYLSKAIALCRQRQVTVIVDETRTGLGRLGALAAGETERGDFNCYGKEVGGGSFPVAAICGSALVFDSVFPDCHQLPAAGSPLACAAVLCTVGTFADERLAANAESMGSYLLQGLNAIAGRQCVLKGVRGKGLLLALDVEKGAENACEAFLGRGVLCTAISDSTVLLTPPLVIARAECDHFLSIAEEVFSRS